METNKTNNPNTNKISNEEKSPRAKTISVTAEMIKEISQDPELGNLIADLINQSEGNLKGTMAYGIAKAMQKQLKLKM